MEGRVFLEILISIFSVSKYNIYKTLKGIPIFFFFLNKNKKSCMSCTFIATINNHINKQKNLKNTRGKKMKMPNIHTLIIKIKSKYTTTLVLGAFQSRLGRYSFSFIVRIMLRLRKWCRMLYKRSVLLIGVKNI